MAPKDRDIAMVFQNYALYPHMTVRENMAFPLKLAKVPRTRSTRRSRRRRRILDLEQHLDRKPANLSGGQRQRVAMGRAIVRDPKAFLMDEPLSNLDAKLRVQMRTEVARLQSDLGTTTVYVTHDQTEAMTLGDRRRGDARRACCSRSARRPSSTTSRPNLFVAGFIGSPAMNFMPAKLEGRVKLPFGEVPLPDELRSKVGGQRPGDRRDPAGVFEDASLVGDARRAGTTFRAKIDLVESMGSEQYAYFGLEGEAGRVRRAARAGRGRRIDGGSRRRGQVVARLDAASQVKRGEEAELWVDTTKLHLFDPEAARA